MQDSQGLLLVLGMAVVTYLPRLLPMLLLSTDKLPSFLKRFFDFVPYAVLTTLIFPEILFPPLSPLRLLLVDSLLLVSPIADRTFFL